MQKTHDQIVYTSVLWEAPEQVQYQEWAILVFAILRFVFASLTWNTERQQDCGQTCRPQEQCTRRIATSWTETNTERQRSDKKYQVAKKDWREHGIAKSVRIPKHKKKTFDKQCILWSIIPDPHMRQISAISLNSLSRQLGYMVCPKCVSF
jgi:hypothetical protein